jgi:dipeptidase
MGPAQGAICDERNQEVAIFQLRSWMPPEIGCIYWRATGALCSSVLIPWYAGINYTPDSYHLDVPPERNVKTKFHFNPPEKVFHYNEEKAFWIFNTLENLVDINYSKNIKKVKPVWQAFEKREFSMQIAMEKKVLELYRKNPELACRWLTQYCNGLALEARQKAQKLIQTLRTKNFGY